MNTLLIGSWYEDKKKKKKKKWQLMRLGGDWSGNEVQNYWDNITCMCWCDALQIFQTWLNLTRGETQPITLCVCIFPSWWQRMECLTCCGKQKVYVFLYVCDSDLLLSCAMTVVCIFQTHTVFVGQTAGGEFFAVRACVVLQVRGARGAT